MEIGKSEGRERGRQQEGGGRKSEREKGEQVRGRGKEREGDRDKERERSVKVREEQETLEGGAGKREMEREDGKRPRLVISGSSGQLNEIIDFCISACLSMQ